MIQTNEKIIKKVEENNVQIGDPVYDSSAKEIGQINQKVYGQNKITEELEKAQKDFDYWNNITQKEIDAKKAKFQKELDLKNNIQLIMEGEVGGSMVLREIVEK